jgi:predicted transcriptional regulator
MIFEHCKTEIFTPLHTPIRGLMKMRRSKMEMYIDILKVMTQNGPMKLTHIMYKANVNCCVLKQNLEFLIQQNLVEEKVVQKKRNKTKIRYVITEKGRTVIKYFNEINIALHITEDHSIPALIR